MDKEDIIRMAREAGLDPDLWNYTDAFERFAALVATAEREACAKVCDGWTHADGDRCAEAIRARDKQ
jgi:hypothetical protein